MSTPKCDLQEVDSTDISVIIQGPTLCDPGNINSKFYKCVESIRQFLPDAEIIVSTWEGQACDPAIVEKVVFNEDPGAMTLLTGQISNYNRMVASTLSGLRNANRTYSLKFRADLTITGTSFFKSKIPPSSNEVARYRIFKRPITISNIFVRNPASHAPLLFHTSDIVQFGLTEDLLDLWNRSHLSEDKIRREVTPWSGIHFLGYTGLRMVSEQTLMTDWLNDHGHEIHLPFPDFLSDDYCELSERTLSANFYVINYKKSDISYPARLLSDKRLLKSIYDAEYVNELSTLYAQKSFRSRRRRQIFFSAVMLRPFRMSFWIDFFATILLKASPRAFIYTSRLWRSI